MEAGEMDGRKKRGGEIPKAAAIWILSTLILAAIAPVSSIDDKCAACNAVAAELEIGVSKEKPRNHLDMRHRLDSKGQREGKVIDYKVSELRVVELLDGLCDKMQDYTLMKLESGQKGWVKVRDWDDLKSDKQEARAYSKDLSSFCGRLLEETEDELAEWIKQGSIEPGGVNKALCQDLSKHCSSSRGSSNVDDREL
ncbi:protein seele [Cocos nucifera]|uniref:Protein seele n=1 Tax=Cocos nucifera TaxID=13894 RepID=A0A8K0IIC1_COCNU|nr:protein seele [Cocos nucifera]